MMPCPPDVDALAVELALALEQAQRTAEAIGMPLAPEGPRALIVGEGELRVGLNFEGGTCESSVGSVWLDEGRPREFGTAHTVVIDGQDALEIRQQSASGMDGEAWLSVVVHEWLHLQHGLAHERSWFYYRQAPLQKRFLKREAHRESVVAAVREAMDAVKDCGRFPWLVSAWSVHQRGLSKRLASFEDRWVTTEGLARHTEITWEQAARGEVPSPGSVAKACAVVDDGDYGYALGCVIGAALDACAEPGWRERAIQTSLGELLK